MIPCIYHSISGQSILKDLTKLNIPEILGEKGVLAMYLPFYETIPL